MCYTSFKKSKSGFKTPKQDIDLIESRWKHAQRVYNELKENQEE
ncbi:hypothetical protein [Candidatus Protochlamydia amoebophila]|uniref:Uncharacterized protein n=1 Tax=Candidatus Protochlamydia amoebophila TaxID=362787 RepID=A0A0C1H068_9BACT|nr:hypothetical protein [Candidatus Protochlamydia amoebophila]KIC71159.1 hypothetical protein DB44_EO00090 [Candidatus Protochlamydia amoebophila]